MRAFSQFDNGEFGFAPKPAGTTILKPIKIGKGGVIDGSNAYLRDVDGEFKILENIARSLGNNTSATGRINLFTELKSCTSCAGAAMQFRQMYPEIQLNIFTGK
jgi:filamentous hemagglutinin